MDKRLKFNEPWILQRADPYVYEKDGWYYFTASVPAYDSIVLRRAKKLADLPQAEEVVIWKKHESGPISKNSAPAFFLLIFNFCRSRSCLSILKFMMLLSHRQTGHSTQTFLYQKAECQVPERRYLQAQAPAEFSFSLLAEVPCRIPAVLYGSGNSPHKSETVLPKHK